MMLRGLGVSGWPVQQGTNSGTVRIDCCFYILHSYAGDSASVGSLHLRQISECAADLFSSSRAVSADLNAHRRRLTTRAASGLEVVGSYTRSKARFVGSGTKYESAGMMIHPVKPIVLE
jgi:hypothetical protein